MIHANYLKNLDDDDEVKGTTTMWVEEVEMKDDQRPRWKKNWEPSAWETHNSWPRPMFQAFRENSYVFNKTKKRRTTQVEEKKGPTGRCQSRMDNNNS